MSEIQDKYSDIRPYNDDEVVAAIERLVSDDEFIQALINYRYRFLAGRLGNIIKPLVRMSLRKKWSSIKTIEQVQVHLIGYLKGMIKNTITDLTYSGLEKLSAKENYLFISNHRDIALDPALINYCLYKENFTTSRIAIGDNLLTKACSNEVMKLNKSFIVKRSIKAPRELLKSLRQLSSYIKHSLEHEKQSVWIAQKEGRAKDGFDYTDPALLKMLFLNARGSDIDFQTYMKSLKIVPVTISYENDPCDTSKVKELYLKETSGEYAKGEQEDINSIIQGIVGFKGAVNVSFAQPVTDDFTTPDELAKLIDQKIRANYKLYPINYLAANVDSSDISTADKELFVYKLASFNLRERELLKTMYAAPIVHSTK